jgi:hypothetical protein
VCVVGTAGCVVGGSDAAAAPESPRQTGPTPIASVSLSLDREGAA